MLVYTTSNKCDFIGINCNLSLGINRYAFHRILCIHFKLQWVNKPHSQGPGKLMRNKTCRGQFPDWVSCSTIQETDLIRAAQRVGTSRSPVIPPCNATFYSRQLCHWEYIHAGELYTTKNKTSDPPPTFLNTRCPFPLIKDQKGFHSKTLQHFPRTNSPGSTLFIFEDLWLRKQ